MIDLDQKAENEVLDKDAVTLRQRKERLTKRFKKLKTSDRKHFQHDFVKLQAHEICNYIKDMQLAPLKAWYNELKTMASDVKFMETFYLTYNEYDEIVPDTEKINSLILPEPPTEDEARMLDSFDFE